MGTFLTTKLYRIPGFIRFKGNVFIYFCEFIYDTFSGNNLLTTDYET